MTMRAANSASAAGPRRTQVRRFSERLNGEGCPILSMATHAYLATTNT